MPRFRRRYWETDLMGIHRSHLRRRVREDAAAQKIRNRVVKASERERRDTRMIEKLKARSLPYSPVVMSWLCRKLGKSSGNITPQDVQTLLT